MSQFSFKKLFRLFLRNWFIGFFLLGMLTGYGIVRFSGIPYSGAQLYETSAGLSGAVPQTQDRSGQFALFISVIRHRLPYFILLLICGDTAAAAPVYILFICYVGITHGILLSLYAAQDGWHGLVVYAATLIPHSICYSIAYILLLSHPWHTLPRKRRTPLLFFTFIFLTLGMLLEVYTSYSLSAQ